MVISWWLGTSLASGADQPIHRTNRSSHPPSLGAAKVKSGKEKTAINGVSSIAANIKTTKRPGHSKALEMGFEEGWLWGMK